jgi:hypothetical protein
VVDRIADTDHHALGVRFLGARESAGRAVAPVGRVATAVVLLVLLAGPSAAQGPAGTPTEYEVKAAFLYNFAKFVHWPPDPESTPFVITVLGRDPFGNILDDTLRGKSIDGRPVAVRRVSSADDVEPSQILFISDSEGQRLPAILERVGTKAILTVGETHQFSDRGGAIRFVVDGDRVRLEINPTAAERSGLRISSDLLRIARIVQPGQER